ncbi:LytR C-terminal domain-containing protein [Prauserella alba]|uniref:LytR/CpsA/Psr regulator C-terminal domain-containing protein n=1 Tax=Prauserella alba TaxID=176898 RepID=A0ABP4FT73_9PSEU|nr:LytR C-terminal domain-containing protein [Prauserella alba]MCP2181501.1 LytR cell envelope-related transcriptional attenuator [Prauserella alba]
MSIFDGLSRPMRAAGLGLLAVAVIAAVIGGVTLVTGGGDQQPAAQETSETNTPGDGDGGQSGSPDEQRPDSGNGSGDNGNGSDGNGNGSDGSDGSGSDGSGSGNGGGDDSGDGGSADGGDGSAGGSDGTGNGTGNGGGNGGAANGGENQKVNVKSVHVRVYNNSTIRGLARTAADDLRAQGWNVVEESNYSDGVIPKSTAYFRPGTDEEHAARVLADGVGIEVAKRFKGIQDSSPGVIVIVTKDYADNR